MPAATAIATEETRESEQERTFRVEDIRAFILAALSHHTVADQVNDLLFEHVVVGRLHPSVVAESLRPIIEEVLYTANFADWEAVTEQLKIEAREALGEEAAR